MFYSDYVELICEVVAENSPVFILNFDFLFFSFQCGLTSFVIWQAVGSTKVKSFARSVIWTAKSARTITPSSNPRPSYWNSTCAGSGRSTVVVLQSRFTMQYTTIKICICDTSLQNITKVGFGFSVKRIANRIPYTILGATSCSICACTALLISL